MKTPQTLSRLVSWLWLGFFLTSPQPSWLSGTCRQLFAFNLSGLSRRTTWHHPSALTHTKTQPPSCPFTEKQGYNLYLQRIIAQCNYNSLTPKESQARRHFGEIKTKQRHEHSLEFRSWCRRKTRRKSMCTLELTFVVNTLFPLPLLTVQGKILCWQEALCDGLFSDARDLCSFIPIPRRQGEITFLFLNSQGNIIDRQGQESISPWTKRVRWKVDNCALTPVSLFPLGCRHFAYLSSLIKAWGRRRRN